MPSKSLSRRSLMGTAALGVAQLGSAVAPPASEKPAPSIIPTKLESSEKLKVAILGCGKRSGAHIRAISHYEDIEISALCDILPEKMEEKKKLVQRGNPRLYTDYQKMLSQADLHAVAIVLPNTLHRETSVAALDAGKHVLCEKPLTLDVSGCQEIIRAADRNRRVLQVGTQSRHAANYAALAEKIHSGLVGNVLYAWIQTFRSDWTKLYADPATDSRLNWRMKQSEGGAVIYEQGIHTVDVFNWFIGSGPLEITAMGGVHNEKLQARDSWDHAGIVVRYANGTMVTYGGNVYSSGGPGPNVLFGDAASLEVGGLRSPHATLHKRTYWRPYDLGRPDPLAGREQIALPSAEPEPTTAQWGYFLESVQGKKPPFPSARHHLPAVQIARGSLISAAERRHVRVSEVS